MELIALDAEVLEYDCEDYCVQAGYSANTHQWWDYFAMFNFPFEAADAVSEYRI